MNIKAALKILGCLTALACCRDARGADPAPELKITIEFHMDGSKNPPPPWKLDNHDPEAFFLVFVENISPKPLLLTDDDIVSLYFEVSDEHGNITKVYQPLPAPASKSRPPWPLTPKETYTVRILYVPANAKDKRGWGLPRCRFVFPPPGGKQQVTIRAVIESMPEKLAYSLKQTVGEAYYSAGMQQKMHDQNIAEVNDAMNRGFLVSGARSPAYPVTLIGTEP